MVTNLRCRSADVNERETSRSMCEPSAVVVVLIADIIDLLLLLSFVPRVVLLNRWIDKKKSKFMHSDQELNVVPSLLERPEEVANEWYD